MNIIHFSFSTRIIMERKELTHVSCLCIHTKFLGSSLSIFRLVAPVHSQELLVIDMCLLYYNILVYWYIAICQLLGYFHLFYSWGLSTLAPRCGFHFVEDPGVIVDCFLQFFYMSITFEFIVFPHIPSLSI